MILKCNNCGAPLDVTEGTGRTRCHYCGQTTKVDELEKVHERTPEGWVPPEKWTPPEHSRLAGQSLVYRPVRAIGRAISLSIRLGILVIVGAGVWRVVGAVNQATNNLSPGALNSALGAAAKEINAAAAAVNGEPIVCTGTEHVTITGRTIRAESGVPVTASGSCQLKLVGCQLVGQTALVARSNAHVTVEGGTFTGAAAAITISGNAMLDASGSLLVNGAPAILASGNARAMLRDATVNGAVETRENASVDAVGAKLLGVVLGTRRVRK